MFCGICGIQIKEGAKFCPNCGWAVPATPIQAESVPEHIEEKPEPAFFDNTPEAPVQTAPEPQTQDREIIRLTSETERLTQEKILEISKPDIISINGKQVPRKKNRVKNKKIAAIIGISEIIISIFFVLSFHIVIGYGDSGIKIFAKDHLTFENTIITSDTVHKIITKYNNADFIEKIQLRGDPLFKKLMDEGIIYRE